MSLKTKIQKTIKNDNKRLVLIIIIILLIIILSIINKIFDGKKVDDRKNSDDVADLYNLSFNSVEEILKYYNCNFIKEEKSKEKGFAKDIYLVFKSSPYQNGKNNQLEYELIMNQIAKVLNANFRLIDENKNLIIEVQRISNENQDYAFSYKINGEYDYFSKQESMMKLKNYKEDLFTNFIISSSILSDVVGNSWKKDSVNFGSLDSEYNRYKIYFDEGIEVRNLNKKIYNIVFTKKYSEDVINGIKVGTDFNEIVNILGKPTFGEINGEYIGYKGEKIYVFFTNSKIYIFENIDDVNYKKFSEVLKKYVDKEINLKTFMNELTYIWDDYEEYKYSENNIYINYPYQGVRISMDKETTLGIEIYSNFKHIEEVEDLITNGKITSKLDKNLYEDTFFRLLSNMQSKIFTAQNIEAPDSEGLDDEEKDGNISDLYYVYYTKNSDICQNVEFIAKNEEVPSRGLNENINSGLFLNSNIFAYGITGKGIYTINIINGEKNQLVDGSDNFIIKSFEDNILTYDEKQLKLMME